MPDQDKAQSTKTDNKDAAVKPDAETLHTTDPQEEMEGPISSIMQGVKEEFEEASEEGDKDKTKD